MSWGPLQPARIDFSDARAPRAPDFGDVYHPRSGALAQARQVFLGGNGLPGRWAGRPRFVVLEAGFGLGHNFLATRDAWLNDAQRCGTLWYVAIEKHPPLRDDLARAHAASPLPALAADLLRQWPPATPDVHLLDFDSGRVRLVLALGDIADVLPELVASVDAFYLDGFAPDRNPAMWDPWRLRQLPRLAAPGATAATWSVAGVLRQGLAAAGFEVHKAPGQGGKREMTVARFAPRFTARPPPGRQPQPGVQRVAVVGAGLAGAATAAALAARGIAVDVIERRPGPAQETSGNAGGLLHGVVHAQDGLHARWLRAAAIHAARVLRPLLGDGRIGGRIGGRVEGRLDGLLRGEHALSPAAMDALLATLALPADHLRRGDWPAAGAAGRPAWLYPDGGWASPADLCAAWLQQPGITLRCGLAVDRLHPLPDDGGRGGGWQVLGSDGQVLAQADAVVLCNAADAQRLAGPAGAGWPLQAVRGQTTVLPGGLPGLPDLPLPLADGGYALRLADGRLLCGATSQPGDGDASLRPGDHLENLEKLARLTGWTGTVDPAVLDGRVGWRLQSSDRLPLLGPLPDAAAPAAAHPRQLARVPGLWVFTALGSRGLCHAPLGAEVLASWLTGDPVPAPAALMDALDPGRFVSRAVRRSGG